MKKHLIPIALLALLLASCSKQEGQQVDAFDTHHTWNDSNPNAFWGKQPGSDTTISLTP